MIKVIRPTNKECPFELILIRTNNKQKLRFFSFGNDEMMPITKEQAQYILENIK